MAAVTLEHLYKAANRYLDEDPRLDPWTGDNGAARQAQRPPEGDWGVWLIMAGRGFGKTRTGAEYIRQRIVHGGAKRITLAGPTASDVRDIMVEGESGLLAVCDRAHLRYDYLPSKRRIEFPGYGAAALLVSSDRPDRYRGLQHDTVWADEVAAWRYADDAWTQMMLGLRIGDDPRAVATTTPRPIRFIRELMNDPGTKITRGTTYENFANLADRFKDTVIKRYEGTTLGRQELLGELVEDVEGALWKRALIDNNRVNAVPFLKKIAVAVDPATTFGEDADETGIAAAGVDERKEVYVLHGSGHRVSPGSWARSTLNLYQILEADEIVAESNQGGEMVKQTIIHEARAMGISPIPRITLIHASRGKRVRAEPVVALYEQGKVHHVGMFGTLEDQMCTFPLIDEDDQVDALVHAVTAVAPAHRRGGGVTR